MDLYKIDKIVPIRYRGYSIHCGFGLQIFEVSPQLQKEVFPHIFQKVSLRTNAVCQKSPLHTSLFIRSWQVLIPEVFYPSIYKLTHHRSPDSYAALTCSPPKLFNMVVNYG